MSERFTVMAQRWFWRFWHSTVRDNYIGGIHTDGSWCPRCGDYHPDQSLTIPI